MSRVEFDCGEFAAIKTYRFREVLNGVLRCAGQKSQTVSDLLREVKR